MRTTFFFVILAALIQITFTSDANAQAKGIDTQNQQIKTVNDPNKTNTGAGRGINFGGGKTPDKKEFANPYRLASKRDILLETITGVLKEKKIIIDEIASKPKQGMLVTQPFTFVKGAVVATNELGRYSNLPNTSETIWTRGRYSLVIEVQSIDGTNNNVFVTAKVEGRSETPLGSEWVTLPSSGAAEQEFLAALVEMVTGTTPNEPAENPNQ